MKKPLLFFLFLGSLNMVQAQNEIFSFTPKTDSIRKIRNMFLTPNKEEKTFTSFFLDKQTVYTYKFDSVYNTIAELKRSIVAPKYSNVVGSKTYKNHSTLFLSNKNMRKFSFMEFDYAENVVNTGDLDIDMKRLEYLINLEYKNKLILLSADRSNSSLVFHHINEDYTVEKKVVDLSEFEFLDIHNKKERLFDAISLLSNGGSEILSISNIQQDLPIPIEETSAYTKIYHRKEKLYITLDESSSYTQIIKINLDDYSFELINIEKPGIAKSILIPSSNSFLIDNQLIQIVANIKELKIEVKDINTLELLNSYTATRKQDISFRNAPIKKQRMGNEKIKELNTKSFLKKLSTEELGISAYKKNDKIHVVFGSCEYKAGHVSQKSKGGEIPAMAAVTASVGAIGGAVFIIIYKSVNPATTSLQKYIGSTSFTSVGIFDVNYKHIPDAELSKNIFDKTIEYHVSKDKKSIISVYNIEKEVFYGAYHKKNKKFTLTRFTE
ncbi:hypothetical protein [Aquimarina sp. MMG016]|uniref:hypothetical protein n=1 Tax=Aquimarina sp. MMG016 TaxID=2822690 RepID=UPI001B39D198|nr:hypothetical protein [Aquimarina sp. MMG016]MBQ4818965.1 hypothetical protein [Aquimarina sp. MMG016]